jgi:G:T/U-mismatch repair DNA glycosylase
LAFIETHPFNQQVIPTDTRILIVGTAPPPRFSNPNCKEVGKDDLDFPFFYGSGKNNFWKYMNAIGAALGTPLPPDTAATDTYEAEARSFLKKHKLWMKDVLQTYQRTDECSSRDNHIQPQSFTDFLRVLDQHRSIDRIAFTSEQTAKWAFTSLNRRDLEKLFFETLAVRKTSPVSVTDIDLAPDCKRFAAPFLAPILVEQFCDRDVHLFQLPSPAQATFPPKGSTDDCFVAIYRHILFPLGRPTTRTT